MGYTVNASEEDKEMAWRRISDLFGCRVHGKFCMHVIYMTFFMVVIGTCVVSETPLTIISE